MMPSYWTADTSYSIKRDKLWSTEVYSSAFPLLHAHHPVA